MSAFGGRAAWRQCRHMTHRGSRDCLRVVVPSPHHCLKRISPKAGTQSLNATRKSQWNPPHLNILNCARRLGAIVCYSAALIQASRSHRTCSDGQRKSCHRLALHLSDPLFGPFAKLVSSRARVHVRDERNTWSRVFHVGRTNCPGPFTVYRKRKTGLTTAA